MKYHKLTPTELFLITLGIAIFLTWIKPWHLTLYLENEMLKLIGLILLFISLLFNTLAYTMFKKHHTPYDPFDIPNTLIDGGVFSISRNPVYLALVLSQCGLGFIFDTVWLLFSALILLIILHYLIVLEEEKVLQRRFKEKYEHYREFTRRWI